MTYLSAGAIQSTVKIFSNGISFMPINKSKKEASIKPLQSISASGKKRRMAGFG
jgi:hypothetical protein